MKALLKKYIRWVSQSDYKKIYANDVSYTTGITFLWVLFCWILIPLWIIKTIYNKTEEKLISWLNS